MKITVTNSSTKLRSLLSAADQARIQTFIAAQSPITVTFQNYASGKILFVETLSKTATTTEGRPVVYGSTLGMVLQNPLDTIYLISDNATQDVRVLMNAVVLSTE